MTSTSYAPNISAQILDALINIVGACFSGVHELHHLRSLGLSAKIFEAGASVGGMYPALELLSRRPRKKCFYA
jgi:cation diffusion facilitator CzcD-associated flavoprotein CzcO